MYHVIVILVVVGVLLWVVNTYFPMDAKIKNILNIVVVICVIVWLLNVFGLFQMVHDVPVPRVHR